MALYQNANEMYKEENYGFYTLTLVQGEKVLNWSYSFSGFGGILSDIGGLGTSIFGILTFVLSSYQEFAYEKSTFKKLFAIDALDHGISSEDSPRSQMLKTMKKVSTSNLSQSYLSLLFVKFLSCCCCCIFKRCDTSARENSWYRRNMQRQRRMEEARNKFNN